MAKKNITKKIENIFSWDSCSLLLKELKKKKISNLLSVLKSILNKEEEIRNKSWLNSLIDEERKKMSPDYRSLSIEDLFSQLYIPSVRSNSFIFLAFFFVFVISHFLGDIKPDEGLYQNLIAIHAGIGTIIFALVIFVAESLRDDEVKDRARVLLKESYLYPLTATEIFVFSIFIAGKVNSISIFSVMVVGFFTIWSLARIIRVLLSKRLFAEKRIEVLKGRLQQSLNEAVGSRIGQNIFLRELSSRDIKLEYNPFHRKKKSGQYSVKTEKRGVIADINFDKLDALGKLIETEAERNGYTYEDTYKTEQQDPKKENELKLAEIQTQTALEIIEKPYILMMYHDKIDDDNDTLFFFDERISTNKNVLEKINQLAEQTFTIKKIDTFSEDVKAEISGVKDQLSSSILNQHLGKIEELRKIYIELAIGYLEFMRKYVGFYSFEQARHEQTSMFGGLGPVEWLSDDIRDIIERAILSRDNNIIRLVGSLPIAVARQAIRYRDPYLYQKFIKLNVFLYCLLARSADHSLKQFVVERCCLYFQETGDFYIGAELRREDLKKEELIFLKDAAVFLLIVLQDFLKETFDAKDKPNFDRFLKVILKIFRHFDPSKSSQNVKSLERRKSRASSTDEIGRIEEKLAQQRLLEEIEEEIKKRKNQLAFGLASWIFTTVSHNAASNKIEEFFSSISDSVPSKLTDLTQTFFETHSFETRDFWGWDWWDMIPDGEVHSIDSFGKLERFYCVKALQIIADKNKDAIKKISLPLDSSIAHLAADNGSLMKILDDIKKNSEDWQYVLNQNAIEKIDLFKELLTDAKKRQEEVEAEELRSAKISQTKIKEFREKVVEAFYESVIVRDILKYYGLFVDKSKEKGVSELHRFGLSVLDYKDAYLDEPRVHYLNWGSSFGSDMARGENLSLIKELGSHCKDVSGRTIDSVLKKFKDISKVFMIAVNVEIYDLEESFSGSGKYHSKWENNEHNPEVNGYEGCYIFRSERLKIFHIFNTNIENKLLIINASKLGKLIQYSPLDEGESKKYYHDIFFIRNQVFSDNQQLEDYYIHNPPDWLKKKGDESEQRNYLKEHVLVHIFERFEFIRHKELEGYVLNVPEKN